MSMMLIASHYFKAVSEGERFRIHGDARLCIKNALGG